MGMCERGCGPRVTFRFKTDTRSPLGIAIGLVGTGLGEVTATDPEF